MGDVAVRLKPFGECQGDKASCMFKDRCPMEGNLYAKGKDKRLRVRNCKDQVSRGRSNRRNGLKGQTKATDIAAVPRIHSLRPGQEEHLSGVLRMEIKQGAQVQPAITAFKKSEKQSEAARPHGDNRPFLAGFVGKESADGVVYSFRARSAEEFKLMAYAMAIQTGLLDE